MTPQCGQTGPSGHSTLSRYTRAASSFWKGGAEKVEFMSSPDPMTKALHHAACGVNDIIAKEIQGNQSIFLGKMWLELGLAWLGFDRFGIGLVIVRQRRSDKEVHAAAAQGASRLTRP